MSNSIPTFADDTEMSNIPTFAEGLKAALIEYLERLGISPEMTPVLLREEIRSTERMVTFMENMSLRGAFEGDSVQIGANLPLTPQQLVDELTEASYENIKEGVVKEIAEQYGVTIAVIRSARSNRRLPFRFWMFGVGLKRD